MQNTLDPPMSEGVITICSFIRLGFQLGFAIGAWIHTSLWLNIPGLPTSLVTVSIIWSFVRFFRKVDHEKEYRNPLWRPPGSWMCFLPRPWSSLPITTLYDSLEHPQRIMREVSLEVFIFSIFAVLGRVVFGDDRERAIHAYIIYLVCSNRFFDEDPPTTRPFFQGLFWSVVRARRLNRLKPFPPLPSQVTRHIFELVVADAKLKTDYRSVHGLLRVDRQTHQLLNPSFNLAPTLLSPVQVHRCLSSIAARSTRLKDIPFANNAVSLHFKDVFKGLQTSSQQETMLQSYHLLLSSVWLTHLEITIELWREVGNLYRGHNIQHISILVDDSSNYVNRLRNLVVQTIPNIRLQLRTATNNPSVNLPKFDLPFSHLELVNSARLIMELDMPDQLPTGWWEQFLETFTKKFRGYQALILCWVNNSTTWVTPDLSYKKLESPNRYELKIVALDRRERKGWRFKSLTEQGVDCWKELNHIATII